MSASSMPVLLVAITLLSTGLAGAMAGAWAMRRAARQDAEEGKVVADPKTAPPTTPNLRDAPDLRDAPNLRDSPNLHDTLEAERAARHRAEARMAEAEARMAEMAASHRDLRTFAATATHDLRDPLRLLAAYLAVIRQRHGRALDQDGLALLRQAEEGARRLDRSLRDMLDYANLAEAPPPRRPVSLADALGRALRDLTVTLQESGGQVDILDPLPQVQAAPEQMQRLFRALIGSALRNRRPGRPPVVSVGCVEDGAVWRFTVRDNGPPVPMAERETLFEPLRRRAFARPEDSGMSLAIARRIVDLHGGRIWLETRPAPAAGDTPQASPTARGTVVCFTLPQDKTSPPARRSADLNLRLGLGLGR